MENYVAVVGAMNIDIWGRSRNELIYRDSNPGEIKQSFGGVGRNIAHNMSMLGLKVNFLTAFGGDLWANLLRQSCQDLGMCVDNAVTVPEARTSTYICLTGPDGELALGLSDTDIAMKITPEVIEKNLPMLNGAQLVVFDGNLSQETMDCLTSRCTSPLFFDPVSVTKGLKLKPFLSRMHTIKPNILEAQALCGGGDAMGCAQELVKMGVKRAFVTAGGDGMAVACGEDVCHVTGVPSTLVNSTGGGDAAMAGLCRSFLDGRDPIESARYAMCCGAITIESSETNSPLLSDEAVKARLATL